MFARRFTLALTTAADGTGTGYIGPIDPSGNVQAIDFGWVSSIRYVKPGSGSYSDGSTITITGETTGIGILTITGMNASATNYPRSLSHANTDGAAGTDPREPIVIASERIKVVISGGGATKTGTFYVVLG
jgi:hypothetical protein